MYLDKEEMEVLYDILRYYLRRYSPIADGPRLETARNLLRRIMKELKKELTEEECLIIGLFERVPPATAEKYSKIKPTSLAEDDIKTMALKYLKSRSRK